MADLTPEALAELFHATYERLAPRFGYETRPETATAWASIPEPNRSLMVAVAGDVLAAVRPIIDAATLRDAADWLMSRRAAEGLAPGITWAALALDARANAATVDRGEAT